MLNFSQLKSLIIPEGNVTQIKVGDNVLWTKLIPKKPIGDLKVGDSVWFKVDGVDTEFIVVNQGNPSSDLYDSTCEGTWLLMKNYYTSSTAQTKMSDNDYSTSELHDYLKGIFYKIVDENVRKEIKTVNVPCVIGNGFTGSVQTLSTTCFLPSAREVGFTIAPDGKESSLPVDGAVLEYFKTDANNRRDIDATWWFRSPSMGQIENYNKMFFVGIDGGGLGVLFYNGTACIRPAFILPFDFDIDEYTVKKSVTITSHGSTGYIQYGSKRYSIGSAFQARVGDEITFHCGDVPGEASIYFNDIKMISDQSSANYTYTIKRDLDVKVYIHSSYEANMFITEIPEDKTTVKVTMLENLPATSEARIDIRCSHNTLGNINITTAGTYELPIGTKISFDIKWEGKGNSISFNSIPIVYGSNPTYEHILTNNIVIEPFYSSDSVSMDITALPEGHVLVQITGDGIYSAAKPGVSYVSIPKHDGVNYSSQTTMSVPIGTVVACTVGTMIPSLSKGCVKVNGNTVLTAESGNMVTYDYTVNGNVTINLEIERNADKDSNGYITITEQ